MARSKSILFPNTLSELSALFDKIQRRQANICLNSPGLVIGSGSKKKVKIANTTYAYMEGVLVKKTTAEVSLTATVTNAKFNVFVISMGSDGTPVCTAGTQAATIGAVVWPTIPDGQVVLGFVIINPTGTGDFVGGDSGTDLDDGTVLPGAVYVNTTFPFIPGIEVL